MTAREVFLWRLEDWARVNRAGRLVSLPRLLGSAIMTPDRACRVVSECMVAWHPALAPRALAGWALQLASKSLSAECEATESTRLSRSLIAKRPVGPSERGLIVVSFESEVDKIARLRRFEDLEREYAIAVLPTWQPFFSAPLFRLAARAQQPFFVWPSSLADLGDCQYLGPRAVGQPLHASSWVNELEFAVSEKRDIDLLMLANFGKYKRHWRLFEAMRDMSPRVRAVLAGRPYEGRDASTLLAEAGAFGVADRVKIVPSPTDSQVASMLGRAKLLCAMSHREGSFIAVAEALMSGTPVAMYANAVIGTKDYINSDTGFLIDPSRPAGPQLQRALDDCGRLRPGRWARGNISAQANSLRLNELMKQHANAAGLRWTADARGFACRNFNFRYLIESDEAELADEYARLRDVYGLELVRPV